MIKINKLNRNFTKKSSDITSDYRLFIILIYYVILGAILFNYYQYQIDPDGITYISIAKSYLSGNFYNSISDYWSPLFSWLLMPFLFFGQTPLAGLHAAKILSLILGFFTIIGLRQLSYRFKMDEVIRTVLLFIMIPVVLYFALNIITPDLLMVCILVYYLTIIFDLDYPNKLSNGILCGILGAFAYLSKSYGFAFFIATFFMLNLLQYFRNSDRYRRKKILKNFILGFTTFLIISSIWIGLISNKDEKLTIGTAGELNYAKVGPQSELINFPGIRYSGQVIPNFEPTMPKSWSPFSSWSNFKHQMKLLWENTIDIGAWLNSFSFISLLIILSCIILIINSPHKLISHNAILYSLITIFICAGGYWMILAEARYLWLIYVLLILMGGYLINLIFKTDIFTKTKFSDLLKTLILLLFAFSFVFMPISFLIENLYTGKYAYDLSTTLMNDYGVQGNIAATNDNLSRMEYLQYYMNFNYCGQPQTNISALELQSELKNYGIDYYFIWYSSNQSSYMKGYKEVTNGTIPYFKVYLVK